MPTFGERLNKLRKERNIIADILAYSLGVKRRIIFSYEKDETKPSYEVLLALSNYFGVSLDFLTGRNDDPRHEDFVENAEAFFIKELETLKMHEKNATFMSLEESLGAIGSSGLRRYESRRKNYSSPLARLKLIFAERENINRHIEHAQKVAKYCKLPEDGPINYIRNKFRGHEVVFMESLGAGEKTPDQLLIEELDKMEADYKAGKKL